MEAREQDPSAPLLRSHCGAVAVAVHRKLHSPREGHPAGGRATRKATAAPGACHRRRRPCRACLCPSPDHHYAEGAPTGPRLPSRPLPKLTRSPSPSCITPDSPPSPPSQFSQLSQTPHPMLQTSPICAISLYTASLEPLRLLYVSSDRVAGTRALPSTQDAPQQQY